MYDFLISVVGLVAMGAIVIGGARYLTSVGNPSAIEDAKHTIYSAIYGLLLALTSWVIINTINPDILALKNPAMSWSATGYAPAAKDPLAMCVGPGNLGNGTTVPCKCMDAKNPDENVIASFGSSPSNLTLSATPATTTVGGGTIAVSGKLTDATTGAPIGGATLKMLFINPSVDASGILSSTSCSWLSWWFGGCPSLITAADGSFSLNLGPAGCSGTEEWQMVFDGIGSSFTASGSNIVEVTATGLPKCTAAANYPTTPAVSFFDNSKLCEQVCSNSSLAKDGQYHCTKPELGVGRTQNEAMNGNQRIISPSSAKVGESIYFDAVTNYLGMPISKLELTYDNSWWNNLGPEYKVVFNSDCEACLTPPCVTQAPTDKCWDNSSPPCGPPNKLGQFIHSYPGPGSFTSVLKVWVKDPGTGTCAESDDKNVIIEVVP